MKPSLYKRFNDFFPLYPNRSNEYIVSSPLPIWAEGKVRAESRVCDPLRVEESVVKVLAKLETLGYIQLAATAAP